MSIYDSNGQAFCARTSAPPASAAGPRIVAHGQVDEVELEAALDGVRTFLDSFEVGLRARRWAGTMKGFRLSDRDPYGPEAEAYLSASIEYFGLGVAHAATLDEVGR